MGGEEESNLLRADFPDTCSLPLSSTPPKPPTQPMTVCFLCIIRLKTDYTHNYTRFLLFPQYRIIAKIKGGFLCIFYLFIVPSTFRSALSSTRLFMYCSAASTF